MERVEYNCMTGERVLVQLTQAEIDAIPLPDYASEKAKALTEARDLRERILARLNGLHIDAIYANDIPPVIAAIMVAKQALKDITIYPTVVAAVDGASTRAAVLARYYAIAAVLAANAPTAVTAFTGLDQ